MNGYGDFSKTPSAMIVTNPNNPMNNNIITPPLMDGEWWLNWLNHELYSRVNYDEYWLPKHIIDVLCRLLHHEKSLLKWHSTVKRSNDILDYTKDFYAQAAVSVVIILQIPPKALIDRLDVTSLNLFYIALWHISSVSNSQNESPAFPSLSKSQLYQASIFHYESVVYSFMHNRPLLMSIVTTMKATIVDSLRFVMSDKQVEPCAHLRQHVNKHRASSVRDAFTCVVLGEFLCVSGEYKAASRLFQEVLNSKHDKVWTLYSQNQLRLWLDKCQQKLTKADTWIAQPSSVSHTFANILLYFVDCESPWTTEHMGACDRARAFLLDSMRYCVTKTPPNMMGMCQAFRTDCDKNLVRAKSCPDLSAYNNVVVASVLFDASMNVYAHYNSPSLIVCHTNKSDVIEWCRTSLRDDSLRATEKTILRMRLLNLIALIEDMDNDVVANAPLNNNHHLTDGSTVVSLPSQSGKQTVRDKWYLGMAEHARSRGDFTNAAKYVKMMTDVPVYLSWFVVKRFTTSVKRSPCCHAPTKVVDNNRNVGGPAADQMLEELTVWLKNHVPSDDEAFVIVWHLLLSHTVSTTLEYVRLFHDLKASDFLSRTIRVLECVSSEQGESEPFAKRVKLERAIVSETVVRLMQVIGSEGGVYDAGTLQPKPLYQLMTHRALSDAIMSAITCVLDSTGALLLFHDLTNSTKPQQPFRVSGNESTRVIIETLCYVLSHLCLQRPPLWAILAVWQGTVGRDKQALYSFTQCCVHAPNEWMRHTASVVRTLTSYGDYTRAILLSQHLPERHDCYDTVGSILQMLNTTDSSCVLDHNLYSYVWHESCFELLVKYHRDHQHHEHERALLAAMSNPLVASPELVLGAANGVPRSSDASWRSLMHTQVTREFQSFYGRSNNPMDGACITTYNNYI